MNREGIGIDIGYDIKNPNIPDDVEHDLDDMGKAAKRVSLIFTASLENVEKLLEEIANSTKRTADLLEKQFDRVGKGAGNAGDRARGAGKQFEGASRGSDKLRGSMSALNNIVRDAPFGIIGIGNNITQLADSLFGAAVAGQVFGLGLSLIVTGLTALSQKYGSVSVGINTILGLYTDAEKAQLKYTASIAGAGDAFQAAFVNIKELGINIDLARQGLLKKDEVLKQYNASLGKTTGSVKSLDEAEKALNKNAEAYIKFTLLKAAAQVALQEAAKKAFEAEQARQKSDRESVSFIFSRLNTSSDTAVQNLYKKNAAKNREVVAKEAEKDQQQFEDIAANLQKKAAQIAAANKFNFFDPKELGPKAKDVKTLSDILKGLEKDLTGLDVAFVSVGGNVQTLAADKLKRLERALKDVSDFGVRPGSSVFKLIDDQINTLQNSLNKTPVTLQIPKLKIEIPKATSNTAANFKALVDSFQVDLFAQELNNKINDALRAGAANLASGIGTAIGEIASGAGSLKDALGGVIGVFADFLKQLGESMIASGAAIIAAKLLITNPYTAIAAGVIAVAAGAAIKASINKAPSFATGGTVYGPTMALVGDNPARKEHILSDAQLQTISGSNMKSVEVYGRLRGRDIELSNRRSINQGLRTN